MASPITFTSAVAQVLADHPEFSDAEVVTAAEAAITADHRAREQPVADRAAAAALEYVAYARTHQEGN